MFLMLTFSLHLLLIRGERDKCGDSIGGHASIRGRISFTSSTDLFSGCTGLLYLFFASNASITSMADGTLVSLVSTAGATFSSVKANWVWCMQSFSPLSICYMETTTLLVTTTFRYSFFFWWLHWYCAFSYFLYSTESDDWRLIYKLSASIVVSVSALTTVSSCLRLKISASGLSGWMSSTDESTRFVLEVA